jgi:hypothetical protein
LTPQVIQQLRYGAQDVIYSQEAYDPINQVDIDITQQNVELPKHDGWRALTDRLKQLVAPLLPVKYKPVELASTQLAREKRPKRIFSGPIDTEIKTKKHVS